MGYSDGWIETGRQRLGVKPKRRHEEDDEQCAFIAWCHKQNNIYPGLSLIFAIPNGTRLGGTPLQRSIVGARLKRAGLRPGVADLFLPVSRHSYHGLFIEMKSKSGSAQPEQKEFGEQMMHQGYQWVVCKGVNAAMEAVKRYYA